MRLSTIAWKSGLAGTGLIGTGILISGFAYRGRLGEKYSPLNHFVSELGEIGVSRLALVFNVNLLLGGLCLVVFLLGLARRIGGWQGVLFGIGGVVCGISGALIGAFPMNNLGPHIFWAMNFFNGGLWVMLLFSMIVLLGWRNLPRWLALPGLLSTLGFATFKFLPNTSIEEANPLASVDTFLTLPRPQIWGMAVFEWMAVLGVLQWALIVALVMLREKNL